MVTDRSGRLLLPYSTIAPNVASLPAGAVVAKAVKFLTQKLTRQPSRKHSNNLRASGSSGRYPGVAAQYEFVEECGRGASSTVLKAICKATGKEVAIKIIELDAVNIDLGALLREAQVMKQLSHPNILPLYCSLVEGDRLWLVMPFVSGGTLDQVLRFAYPQGLPEKVLATVARKVLKGLQYLHNNGIAHRDIKPSNILLSKQGDVYLGDLGIAAQVRAKDERNPQQPLRLERTTFVGTFQYMSPEVVEGVGYDERADIWSFGMTMLELATGRNPYEDRSMIHILTHVVNDEPPCLGSDCCEVFRDFLSHCLVKDPAARWSASKLLEHRFKKLAKDEQFLKRTVLSQLPSKMRSVPIPETYLKIDTSADVVDPRSDSGWDFRLGEDILARAASGIAGI